MSRGRCVFGFAPPKVVLTRAPAPPRPAPVEIYVPPGTSSPGTSVDVDPTSLVASPVAPKPPLPVYKPPIPVEAAPPRPQSRPAPPPPAPPAITQRDVPWNFGLSDLGLNILSSKSDIAKALKANGLKAPSYVVDLLYGGKRVNKPMVL